jgi:polyhydroxybutyrate depolymerase
MKRQILLLLCIVFVIRGSSQTNNTYTITSGSVQRSYILYVPAQYNASHPTPLLFNFHGYGSNDTQQEGYGEFRPIADTANFLIVLPQGLVSGGYAGFSNFGTVASASVDLDFTNELIDSISAKYNIDPCRIYSTGMSNGGFMSHDLACFLSNRFAAIASVSGSMMPSHASACNPTHPLPVMQIHGTSDSTVAYDGKGGIIASIDIDTLIQKWVSLNHCNPLPVLTAVPNVSTTDNCTAQHYVYSGGSRNSTVEFYKIIGGGHAWPGASYNIPGINTNQDFSASKEIWRFLRQYSLCTLTGVQEVSSTENELTLFPNPVQSLLSFTSSSAVHGMRMVTISDITGRVVLHQQTEGESISIESLSPGLYFLSLREGSQREITAKFIKN